MGKFTIITRCLITTFLTLVLTGCPFTEGNRNAKSNGTSEDFNRLFQSNPKLAQVFLVRSEWKLDVSLIGGSIGEGSPRTRYYLSRAGSRSGLKPFDKPTNTQASYSCALVTPGKYTLWVKSTTLSGDDTRTEKYNFELRPGNNFYLMKSKRYVNAFPKIVFTKTSLLYALRFIFEEKMYLKYKQPCPYLTL